MLINRNNREGIQFYGYYFICMHMKKTIKLNCTECNIEFQKTIGNYNRAEKLKHKHFCNRSCRTIYMNKNLNETQKTKRNYIIVNRRFDITDEYSPFKTFINRTRQSDTIKRYGISDLDVKYLKNLWNFQKGRCGYTGVLMILPKSTGEYDRVHSVKKLSLDRIDSSKGYLKGNVHFVCIGMNLAKRNLPHNEMLSLIQDIKLETFVPDALKMVESVAYDSHVLCDSHI